MKRIDHRVDDVAEQVTDGGGSDHRNEQVGARPHAIAAQSVAERAEMVRQAGGAGHIDHPTDANRRVGHETHRRRPGPSRPKLQHIVYDHHRFAEVDEDMVDGLADRPRREGAIEHPDDPQPVPHEGHLNGEPATIEAFERIVHRRSSMGRASGAKQGQGRTGGDQPAAGA
ncbi:MAG TPA: hypothetical protein VGI30_12195 [Caulobacteraceae bacterium]